MSFFETRRSGSASGQQAVVRENGRLAAVRLAAVDTVSNELVPVWRNRPEALLI